jgi:hypothetical protein
MSEFEYLAVLISTVPGDHPAAWTAAALHPSPARATLEARQQHRRRGIADAAQLRGSREAVKMNRSSSTYSRYVTSARGARRLRPIALAIAICAAVVLPGCKSSTESSTYQPARSLEGSWRWVSSLHLSSNTLHTPQSEGFEATLRFDASTGTVGRFLYSRTGASATEGQFGIGYEDAPGNDFITLQPGIDYLQNAAWLTVTATDLILDGSLEGGYRTRYMRIITD